MALDQLAAIGASVCHLRPSLLCIFWYFCYKLPFTGINESRLVRWPKKILK
jgi:hypothetical protein